MADSVKRFTIWNRLQGDNWTPTTESFDSVGDAVSCAGEHSLQPMLYGMTQVYDQWDGVTVVTFPGGYAGTDPAAHRAQMQQIAAKAFSGYPFEHRVNPETSPYRTKAPQEAPKPPEPKPVEPTQEEKDSRLLFQRVSDLAQSLGIHFKGLESVSVALSWKDPAATLVGAWSDVEGRGVEQAGVYRLMNTVSQLDKLITVFSQLTAQEIKNLNQLIREPTANESPTTEAGPKETSTGAGSTTDTRPSPVDEREYEREYNESVRRGQSGEGREYYYNARNEKIYGKCPDDEYGGADWGGP